MWYILLIEMIAIRDKLRSFIEDHRLNGSYRLPSERDLAAQLKVSRLTISKAMAHLAGEGMIERRHGSGTYIIENSRENRTYNIGVALRRSYHSNAQHFLKMVKVVSEASETLNLHLQIFDNLTVQFNRNPINNSLVRTIDSGALDGLLLLSRMPVKIIGSLQDRVPLVAVNSNAFGYLDIPSVCCDYYEAGFVAAEHLIRNGHIRLGYASEYHLEHPEIRMHLSGMKAACRAFGAEPISQDDLCVIPKENSIEAVRAYLDRTNPTAIFARSDMVSAMLIRMFDRLGVRVPDDISLVGEGNYSWGGEPDLPLSTIDNKLDDMCRTGLEMLRKLLQGDKDLPQIMTMTPELIERKSVKQLTA